MSKISDVAKAAGVSVTTVSNVLNNKNKISIKTQKLVMYHVKKLNYKSNIFAKRLRTNKNMCVAIIIPNILNPFFAKVYRLISRKLKKEGFTSLLIEVENKKMTLEILESLMIDGIISCSLFPNNIIKKYNKPVIFVDQMQSCQYSAVILDNIKAMAEIVNELYKRKHHHIAYVGSNPSFTSRSRVKGFKKAMKQHKLNSDYIFKGDFEFETGVEFAKEILENKKYVKISAIICGNDLIALGIYNVFSLNNIRIPDDISVLGFDNTTFSWLISPKLTSYRQNIENLADKAVLILLDQLREKTFDPKINVCEGEWIIRESLK